MFTFDSESLFKVLINGCSASEKPPKKRSIDSYVSILRWFFVPQCAVQRDFEQVLSSRG